MYNKVCSILKMEERKKIFKNKNKIKKVRRYEKNNEI